MAEDADIKKRLEEAEDTLDALREHEIDAVLGAKSVMLLRLQEVEKQLRESEHLFREVVNNLPLSVWLHDAEGRQQFVNDTFCEFFGVSADAMQDDLWMELIHPDDRAGYCDAFQSAIEEQKNFHAEVRVRRADGEWRWLESWGRPRLDSDGRFIGIAGSSADVTERKEAEQLQRTLVAELNHRVKNALAVALSVAQHALRSSDNMDQFKESFFGRLTALAEIHGLLTSEQWNGVSMRSLVETATGPFAQPGGPSVCARGSGITRLNSRAAQALYMVLHELSTNAMKYGALSTPEGRVDIEWELDSSDAQGTLVLSWEESGGPPVAKPERKGFGSQLIEKTISYELGGETELAFAPSGVAVKFKLPLGSAAAGRDESAAVSSADAFR